MSPDTEQDIIKFANSLQEFKKEPYFEDWCWNRWSESSKWSEDKFMQELSLNFSNIMFRVDCKGDYTYKAFWLGGKCLDAQQIWISPKFPTSKEFNDAFVRIEKQEKKIWAEQEQQEKERELLEAKNRLLALEKEKDELLKKLEAPK